VLHVRGRGLPDGEPVEWWIADGVLHREPVAGADTIWDGGWIIPGLVDAHCHVGLGPHGEIPIDEAIAQAETERGAGALLLRDCGSPTTPAASTTITTCRASFGRASTWPAPSATGAGSPSNSKTSGSCPKHWSSRPAAVTAG